MVSVIGKIWKLILIKRLEVTNSNFEDKLLFYIPESFNEVGRALEMESAKRGTTELSLEWDSAKWGLSKLAEDYINSLEGGENLNDEDRENLKNRFIDNIGIEGLQKNYNRWRNPVYVIKIYDKLHTVESEYYSSLLRNIYAIEHYKKPGVEFDAEMIRKSPEYYKEIVKNSNEIVV